MKHFLRIYGVLIGLCLSTIGYSQVDNSFFTRVDTTAFSSGSPLQLQLDHLSFARNSEYTSRITKGRTMMGYQLETNLRYRIASNAYIKGGLWLKQDFGSEGFHQVLPLFALHVKQKNTEFIFGNLIGTTDHMLIEPILDPEFTINDRVETGLQVRHTSKLFHADVWVDWQKMIYQNSPFQEQFVAGVNSELNLIKTKGFEAQVFAQGTAFHRGGEIDATISQNVSRYNFNYGTKLSVKPKASALKSLEFRADFAFYEDQSTRVETFIDGLGQLVSVRADFDALRFMLQYWDSHQFQSAQGDRIYHSFSRVNPSVHTQNYRKMLILRGAYETEIADQLSFMFRAQMLHDVHEQTQDVVTELFFRWKFAHNFNARK